MAFLVLTHLMLSTNLVYFVLFYCCFCWVYVCCECVCVCVHNHNYMLAPPMLSLRVRARQPDHKAHGKVIAQLHVVRRTHSETTAC